MLEITKEEDKAKVTTVTSKIEFACTPTASHQFGQNFNGNQGGGCSQTPMEIDEKPVVKTSIKSNRNGWPKLQQKAIRSRRSKFPWKAERSWQSNSNGYRKRAGSQNFNGYQRGGNGQRTDQRGRQVEDLQRNPSANIEDIFKKMVIEDAGARREVMDTSSHLTVQPEEDNFVQQPEEDMDWEGDLVIPEQAQDED